MRVNHLARREFWKTGVGAALAAGFPSPGSGAQASGGAGARAGIYDVLQFGAAGDGKTADTAAINRAIDTAAAAGGGTVRFPQGTYLSQSIHLTSNITLFLDTGSKLVAAESGYDAAEPNGQWEKYQDFGHNHWHNSLIWGENLENIAIAGPGLIWGKGLSRGYGAGPKAEDPGVGNKAIALKRCHNVILRDFSILQGGHFGILATGVDNLTIDNLKIDTNRDGMDVDCCRNVRISNCSVNSPWDDGICLKSSYALGEARATDMVTITNCLVSGSFELGALLDASYRRFPADSKVPRTGRIKFGTESNGGFKNVTISNCVFEECQGLALETVDGALLEDVAITNITMRDITSAPLFLRLGSRMRGPQGVPVGSLKRVIISGIVCHNSASRIASVISGIPGHYIEDLKLSDLYLQYRGGGTNQMAANEPPEQENAYPEPGRFFPMPASGFYIRHAKNLDMSNIEISTTESDSRPAFFLRDVRGADFFRIKSPAAPGVSSFELRDVQDFTLGRGQPGGDVHLDQADHKSV